MSHSMGGLLAISLCVLMSCTPDETVLSVDIGPTAIPRGDAIGAADITINNGLFAVAFAVDTAPPWGVARGGIVDISIVRNGELDYDIASLADFMPNNWSSWPTTYQRVSIEEQTTDEVVIKTERDWGDVELVTLFHIRTRDSKIQFETTMTNNGADQLDGLLSGYVVWPDGGNLRAVPVRFSEGAEHGPGGWTAAYDETWALGLHAPFSDVVTQDGRDRYLEHDLAPGETRSFEGWLQIENEGSLAPMVQTDIEFGGLSSGRVSGQVVSDDGKSVDSPAVVVQRDGTPIFWTLGSGGRYDLRLPGGDYEIYATARGYGQSSSTRVTITEGSTTSIDFDDVRPPGSLQIQVNDQKSDEPLDARISIKEGQKPLIGFFGKDVYFTELERVGEVVQSIAPGRYVFEVSAAGGFTSSPQMQAVVVESGKTQTQVVSIPVLAAPHDEGWYNADMHHHSDVLDGFTEAQFVMRSELAAGVNIAFLSDHDSVINNNEMRKLSQKRSVPFIPGTELSPSWGHFNAYPVDDGTSVDIDTGQSSVQEIFAEARRMGADIVSVNHPNSEYGYFESLRSKVAPGGYDDGFDLVEIEINEYEERNRKTLQRVWQMWNEGQEVYLAAGSDAHDVWTEISGSARSYVYVDGELSIEKFVAALKAGHSFASQGPLIFPEILFGSQVSQKSGEVLDLRYSVQAVSGLKSVNLIGQGSAVEEREMSDEVTRVDVEFTVKPESDTWYSLIVEDSNGNFAYTNPVWVSIAN